MTQLPVKAIRVENRVRRDLGSLRTLERSIDDIGLLQPILVRPNADGEFVLLAGARRLSAVRNLGWEEVPAIVVTTLLEATDLLRAERDENTERKAFNPTELGDMAKRLRAIEEPAAAERKAATQAKPGQRVGGGNLPAPSDQPKGRTRDKVAEALGVGATSLRKIEAVVDAATDDSLPEPVRAVAAEAAAEMDATGNVDRAHKKVETAKKAAAKPAETPEAIAASGYRKAVSAEFSKARDGLLKLKPERMAEVLDRDGIERAQHLTADLRRWCDDVDAALRRPTLKVAK